MSTFITKSLKNAVILSIIMGATALVAKGITPTEPLTQRIGPLKPGVLIPESFGEWRLDKTVVGAVVNPQQEAFVNQIYSEVLSRTYVDKSGHRIMLSVAYGEDQRRQSALHYPEVCYPAQGFIVKSTSAGSIKLDNVELPVRRLSTVLHGQRFEPITYWVVVGEEHVEGAIDKKLSLIRYGVRGLIADGFIFRVSSLGKDAEEQFVLQDKFVSDLMSNVLPAARARLSGV
jgi:EpsI family protein